MSIKQAFGNSFRALNQGLNEAGRQFVNALGVTGTQVSGGQVYDEDYGLRGRITRMLNWDDPAERSDMVDEMITDSTIEAVRNAIELPIKTAPITVEPADGKQAKNIDKQIADALEQDLLNNPNFNFDDVLEHMLTALWYGNVIMVKEFEMAEGRVRWRGWYYRKQRTIDRWDVNDRGQLLRVHQTATSTLGEQISVWIPEEVAVSGMESPLFHFSYKQLGNNFNGVSLLRQAFAPWFIKRHMLLNLAVQSEVAATGIPLAKYKTGIPPAGSTERTAVQAFLKNLHSLAQNWGEIPEGVDIEVFGGEQRFGFDQLPGLKYLDQAISSSVLAQFLEQPKSTTGSYAMQDKNIDFFLDSCEAWSNKYETVLNDGRYGTQNVKQYVNLNWANVTEYPKVRIAQINTMSMEKMMEVVTKYVEAGGPMQPDDWNKIRERMGWSAMELKDFKDEFNRRQQEPTQNDTQSQ